MASPQKLKVEVELKCNAEKVWEGIKYLTTVLPKASPDNYESIEVVEGDGVSVGSIYVIKHPQGFPFPLTKKKIELVDEEKRTMSYIIIGGDIMKYYKNYKASVVITPKGKGTLLTWFCEVNKTSEDAPDLDAVEDLIVKTARDLEAYLLKA